MKVVTAAEMVRIDRTAIDEYGIPGELLMAYAGRAVVDVILDRFSDAERFVIFAGGGNNGGDGFVIAWLLHNMKKHVTVYFFGDEKRISDTSAVYFNICKEVGVEVKAALDLDPHKISFHGTDLIVDALFGTGFTGTPRGAAGQCIEAINKSGKPVCAVDIPSGLPSDGEAPAGSAVRADCTVTMGLPKVALVTWPGREYAGELFVADIGFPKSLTESEDLKVRLIDRAATRDFFLPSQTEDVSKADRGHLLLIGGFDGMEGAIMMTARAALETGVGLVSLMTTPGARQIIAGIIPELITLETPETGGSEPLTELLTGRRYDALVIGPGLGRTDTAQSIFYTMMEILDGLGIRRVLIDGDGLYFFASWLKKNKLPSTIDCIITPHFMEASRITGTSVDEIRRDRFGAARSLADETGAVAVLKGPASIIAGSEQTGVNASGNAAMATAGSGDVLAGIIGALLLKKKDVFETACAGTWLHGSAGDGALKERGKESLKATDIIEFIS